MPTRLIGAAARLSLVWLSLACLSGCGEPQQKQPAEEPPISYADALTIYNEELRVLDRLKAERAELRKVLEGDASLELVEEVLGQSAELRGELIDTLGDLDGARGEEEANQLDALQKQKLQEIEQTIASEKKSRQQDRPDIEQRIKQLDEQIAQQQKKVDRALADKEAAEKRR